MDTKVRLTEFANEVKRAGLAGQSMQAKLSELIEKNDLTNHEIDRIAEMANRETQLALYKQASDKRFKFDLIDPEPLKIAARKQAAKSLSQAPGRMQKTAAIVEEADGDPFATPYRPVKFSLYEQPMNMKMAAEMEVTEIRKTAFDLDRMRAELELVKSQGLAEELKIAGKAEKTFNESIQAAIDLIIGGITLPSLYTAVVASAGGEETDKKAADDLMLLIIKGIRERGIPNHRLGFRNRGNVELLDRLKPDDLLMLCKRSTGRIHEHDIPLALTKVASLLADTLDPQLNQQTGSVVQPYLDEKNVSNTPDGKPLVINGENEFVIGIKDLIGDQSRMRRCHSANEYIGLKLKQIEQALQGLASAKKTAETKMAALPNRAGVVEHATNALGSLHLSNAIGLTGLGLSVAPMVASAFSSPEETPEEKMNRRLKTSNAKLAVDVELKTAFIPAVIGALSHPALSTAVGAAGLGLTAYQMGTTPDATEKPKKQTGLPGMSDGARPM